MIQKQELRATIAAQAPATRTVDVLFYSGAKVERYDFWRDEEYLLQFEMTGARLDRLNGGAPFLKDHWPSVENTIGKSTKAWVENGKAYASFELSQTSDVDVIWSKIQSGILTDVSMGVQIFNTDTIEKKGEKKLILATDWEPYEVSVVAIGADPKAGFLAAQSRDEFMAILEKIGMRPDTLRQEVKKVLESTGAAGNSDNSPITETLRARVRGLSLTARIRQAMLRLA